MFNKKELDGLQNTVESLEDRIISLRRELTERRVLRRYMNSAMDTTYKAISLEDLETMQQRILDYLNVELKTTPEKTELVKNEMQDKDVCAPQEDLKVKPLELDLLVDCKVCPKCGGKGIQVMYLPKDSPAEYEHLEKWCDCGYGWIESCLDVKKNKLS